MLTLSDRQSELKKLLKQQLVAGNRDVTFDQLEEKAARIADVLFTELTSTEVAAVVADLTREETIVLEDGGTVVNPDTFERWLADRAPQVSHSRYDAYERLLVSRDWAAGVIRQLAKQTDEVVELLGDPTKGGTWARRGLLVGEVQSGKTATYIGILNKAIDYGYRLVIVIGGHTNDLRSQTQKRIDSDLTGIDSDYLDDHIADAAVQKLGIAQFDPDFQPNVLTTVRSDFNANAKRAGIVWVSSGNPTIFVIKKNAGLIRNVADYIRRQAQGGRLDTPLVVIDDESDWGTPNTKTDTDPAAVNRQIRRLLDSSRRSSYLGITATPFANMFIDHEATQAELGNDLFPADYIRAMSSPSDYQGIAGYFSEAHPAIQLDVEDCMELLPVNHKSDHIVDALPDSMRDAIVAFYLGTAIRRVRREGVPSEASMLINVSRFNDVQRQVFELVEPFCLAMNGVIRSELLRSGADTGSELRRRIERVWQEQYSNVDVVWGEISSELIAVAESLTVELVNRQTAAARAKARRLMTREQRREQDLRPTIFIGGDVLSRGLTLDGLQVSYFVREPRSMDTLMQMGRWFGYRPGYGDLVRVWMPESTRDDFQWSSEVTAELRDLLLEMRAKELTPQDFGLRVRAHPEGFQVVAANKRKAAEIVEGTVLIHGQKFESHFLSESREDRRRNREALQHLIERLRQEASAGVVQESISNLDYRTWSHVAPDAISDFFREFKGYRSDIWFGGGGRTGAPQIANHLGDARGGEEWRVVLVEGTGDPVEVADGITVNSSIRNAIRRRGDGALTLGNRRVATATNLAGALSKAERDALQGSASEASVIASIDHPMLLAFTMTTKPTKDGRNPEVDIPTSDALVGVVLVFPDISDEDKAEILRRGGGQRFWVNTVELRNLFGYVDDGDDIEVGDE